MSRIKGLVAISGVALVALALAPQGGSGEGQRTFETICATCHSMDPPPKLAPPMSHVARHYRQAFKTEQEAVDAMVAFVMQPDTARMTMPRHAMERFGLMPKLPLAEPQVRAVAKYVMGLSAPAR